MAAPFGPAAGDTRPKWSMTSGTAARLGQGDELRRLADVDMELDVPTEAGDAAGERVEGRQGQAAPVLAIDANAADAGAIEDVQARVGEIGGNDGDGAETLRVAREGVEDEGVVGAVDARLDEDGAADAIGVHQPGIVGKRRGNRRVVALRRQRIARGRAEDMDMGIAGPLRQAEAGKRPRRERRETKGRDINRFSRHCRYRR